MMMNLTTLTAQLMLAGLLAGNATRAEAAEHAPLPVAPRGAALLETFRVPPDSARMWTWWFWLGDKVDRESITADLEALKAQGMGGVTVYSLSGQGVTSKGPNYMSPEWRGLFQHTVKEAGRLGLGVSAMLCSGWNAGGPWIQPAQACKRHVSSELVLRGPRHFTGKLPAPPADARFYQDVAVQAYPVNAAAPVPVLSASSSHARYPAGNAADGDPNTFWVSNGDQPNQGPSRGKPEWLVVDLGGSRVVHGVTIAPRPGYGPRDAEFQVSSDNRNFTTVKSIVMEKDKPMEFVTPGQPLRYLRLFITSSWSPRNENVQVCEFIIDGRSISRGVPPASMDLKTMENSIDSTATTTDINAAPQRPLPVAAPGSAIDPATLIDLTAKCGGDGTLDWDVPDGQWKVLRSGYTLTGKTTTASSPTGIGFEADPLDAKAMDFQFANAAAPLIEDAGPLAGKVFRSVQIDSWETDLPNWSGGFIDDFRKFRGYDPRPYLPALTGRIIHDSAVTDRFLYDYRRTLADCVAEHYFGRLSKLAEAKGLVQQSEAGGVSTPKVMALDALKNLGRCAIPMGEFWQDGTWIEANQNKNGKQTASAAHLYGKTIAAAEAFTSFVHWVDSPATLKPTADRAFCEGFNHFFIFSSATHSGDGVPGNEFYAGTHFNRKITWWNQAHCFTDYVARCSHLLQQGLFAADVLFYNGDGCPNFVPPKHIDPALGPGYDYDVCNTEILLTRLAVKDRRIVLPDGMSYRLLVLPDGSTLPVEVLRKLKDLVATGMTVVGPKPATAPGLRDYPRCDQEVQSLAAELWGDCDGKNVLEHAHGNGRVVWGITPREILARSGVKQDFSYVGGHADAFVDWIHRTTDDTEIYFLANRKDRTEPVTCTFRVTGKLPELWDPVTGTARQAGSYAIADGLTSVPLEFAPNGSIFVVFREPTPLTKADGLNFPQFKPLQELTCPWALEFDPQWGGPPTAEFNPLVSWTQRPEDGIKFYSGTATYRKTFDLSLDTPNNPPAASRLVLDLGAVRDLADVRLNGKNLGIVWTAPWQLDITDAVKPGTNALEIRVTNLWPNRLLGDAARPVEQRLTSTNITADRIPALLPSGLLGPVRIVTDLTPHAGNR